MQQHAKPPRAGQVADSAATVMTRTAIFIAALGVLSGAIIGSVYDDMWPFGAAVAGSAVVAAVFFYGIAAILNVLGAILLELWQQRQPLTTHHPQRQSD